MSRTLSAQYNLWLVALSLAIAVAASYTALALSARMTYSEGRSRAYWLAGGATVMGMGIWSMHYVGMLALSLPVPVLYDLPTVLFSAGCAVLASAVALVVVSRREMTTASLLAGGVVMGTGIAGMHYSGMTAMRLAAHCSYSPGVVALSLVIAAFVSFAALWITFRCRNRDGQWFWRRIGASTLMGLAIALMHYVGMAAMTFQRSGEPANVRNAVAVSALGAFGLVLVTFFVLALAIVSALLDRRFSVQQGLLLAEQERWRLLMQQDGIFDADLITGSAFHSPRWLEIIGYLPGELPDRVDVWWERIHPEDLERTQSHLRDYLQHRVSLLNTEYRLHHRDGSWRWILVRGQAVWDQDDRPVRLVGTTVDISVRKQTEAKLQASENRFEAFMQNSPALALLKDASGRMIFTNAALNRKWNLEPNEWSGKTDFEIWPADVAGRIRAVDIGVLASDQPVEVIDGLPMPDGSVRQFLFTKFSFDDVSGDRLIAGLAQDVTDRVESKRLLQESEARYRELFEHNPLPAWTYSLRDLRFLEVNAAAIAHYGWTREEFLELSLHSIRMEGEAEALEEELTEYSRLGKVTRPWRNRRKNGSCIWVEIASHEINSGDLPARLVVVHDVTSRISAECEVRNAYLKLETLVEERTSELRASEARWRGLIEATPQFIWSTTPEGSCTYLNQQFLDYTGMTLGQMAGTGWLDAVHPADQEQTIGSWRATTKSCQAFESEHRFRAATGTYRWFKVRGVPIRDGQGQVTQWFGVCTDIDENKRSEERLEAAVKRRTAELAEARDKAELAARSKAQFLATMSHEIRTPMNGVIGMASLLADTSLTSDQRCYLETIRSSGEALLGIINDVLDFSKMEAGKLQLEKTEFDLETVMEEATELVAAAAAAKNIELSFTVDNSTPLDLIGDPGRLRQILLNLLSNGVKFTDHGSVKVSVTQEARHDDFHVLRFTVKDTGIGLTAGQAESLFQAFTQADPSTTRRFGGTGLGLSIAKRLVEIMGGTIGVSSRPGQGSTFWFNICLQGGRSLEETSALRGVQLLVAGKLTDSRRQYLLRSGLTLTEHAAEFTTIAELASAWPDAAYSVDALLVDAGDIGNVNELKLRPGPFAGLPVLVMGSPNDWPEGPDPGDCHFVFFVAKPIRRRSLLLALEAAIRRPREAARVPLTVRSGKGESVVRRILVAEDNLVNQMVVRLLLEKLGCRVEVVGNGKEACAAAREAEFDLILMDCHMPVMDGFEATRCIRQEQAGRSRTPIIALTAAVLEEERAQCYAAGMDDFLGKPIAGADLERVLYSWSTTPA